jgi:beta-1,4-mannosyltransferase
VRYHRSRAAPAAIIDQPRIRKMGVPRMRVVVVVLGDLGRSPRMLYHALALADSDADVELVGYRESELPDEVARHPRIRVWPLRAEESIRAGGIAFVARGVLRVVRQGAELLRLLVRRVPAPDVLLVQNPPAVPALALALVAARVRRARLVVDWHNFGWSMLAARLDARHPIVRLARVYERACGWAADAHLCVSDAMCDVLARDLGVVGAVPFHDRPAARFVPLASDERTGLRTGLAAEYGIPERGRPLALLVSPTSWTADEDFDLLLEAAHQLDARLRAAAGAPDVVVVVTGRGPLRAQYEAIMAGLGLEHVHLRTRWLAPDVYPRFLAAADLGISLHRSTSGVDLPMKVADLLGAGVPVCALDYGPCLAELVHDGRNGRLFRDAGELARQVGDLLDGFPDEAAPLATLRRTLADEPGDDWQARWRAAAAPVLLAGRAP